MFTCQGCGFYSNDSSWHTCPQSCCLCGNGTPATRYGVWGCLKGCPLIEGPLCDLDLHPASLMCSTCSGGMADCAVCRIDEAVNKLY